MNKQRLVRSMILTTLAALVVAGCVAVNVPDNATPTRPVAGPLNPSASGPDAEAAAELAKQALLTQLGVVALDVDVDYIEAVQWADTALGCPAPDKVYLQVIVPGYKLRVTVNGQAYNVHVGGENAVVCTSEGTPLELNMMQPAESTDAVVNEAKAHLAERLSLSLDRIELVKAEAVQWRSSGLGCEQPGQKYLSVIVPGHLIVLQVGDDLYEYHSGDGRMVTCDTTVNQ